ncbi:MAG: DUF1513 domain-containing protein, partial [Rubrivivax sp.]|nr:DUF1513 domain-containing protein [Rubrivivax sp.]
PGSAGGPDFVGLLHADWGAQAVRVQAALPVPSRAHGLLALAGGGFVAVAARPGGWLLRCDAQGGVVRQLAMADDTATRSLNGHVAASADGHWLYTTETDRTSGLGWVSVRDLVTLARVAQWPSHGLDPHQLVLDRDGALLLANGGIPRSADGKKRELALMDPSLVRLHPRDGELLDQWRLADRRLSLRHLVWNQAAAEAPALLGIALQAEHDEPSQRQDAPLLALWDGRSLSLPSTAAVGSGYAGDIAAGPGGGFVVSGQRIHRALWWQPQQPGRWTVIGELQEVCALSAWPGPQGEAGVLIGGLRGLARWHPRLAPAMLRWPNAMQPDNHWVRLG